jgi:alpha-ketoglutarate-dependent taurine dioxygenase
VEPQVYSLLFAVEIPDEGGETEYCNLTAAYEALDPELKRQLAPLRAVHAFVRRIPPVVHPVVRTHPISGRKALFVSPGLTRSIEGMDEAESKVLLARLFEHSTEERFCWKHRWQVGDALMWDNRCTMHRRHRFDTTQRRIVRRTQTIGEPVQP